MKETETFYWKDENGETTQHHISEFRTYLERGSGHCVSEMEQRETIEAPTEYLEPNRPLERVVVDQGSTPEKEVAS